MAKIEKWQLNYLTNLNDLWDKMVESNNELELKNIEIQYNEFLRENNLPKLSIDDLLKDINDGKFEIEEKIEIKPKTEKQVAFWNKINTDLGLENKYTGDEELSELTNQQINDFRNSLSNYDDEDTKFIYFYDENGKQSYYSKLTGNITKDETENKESKNTFDNLRNYIINNYKSELEFFNSNNEKVEAFIIDNNEDIVVYLIDQSQSGLPGFNFSFGKFDVDNASIADNADEFVNKEIDLKNMSNEEVLKQVDLNIKEIIKNQSIDLSLIIGKEVIIYNQDSREKFVNKIIDVKSKNNQIEFELLEAPKRVLMNILELNNFLENKKISVNYLDSEYSITLVKIEEEVEKVEEMPLFSDPKLFVEEFKDYLIGKSLNVNDQNKFKIENVIVDANSVDRIIIIAESPIKNNIAYPISKKDFQNFIDGEIIEDELDGFQLILQEEKKWTPPTVEELYSTFTKINSEAKEKNEEEIPLSNFRFYEDQIYAMYFEDNDENNHEGAKKLAIELSEYSKTKKNEEKIYILKDIFTGKYYSPFEKDGEIITDYDILPLAKTFNFSPQTSRSEEVISFTKEEWNEIQNDFEGKKSRLNEDDYNYYFNKIKDFWNDTNISYSNLSIEEIIQDLKVSSFYEEIKYVDLNKLAKNISEKIKDELKSIEKGRINKPEFRYYITNSENNKIIQGFEYKEDTKTIITKLRNQFPEKTLIVLSKRELSFSPDDNSNWETDIIDWSIIDEAINYGISQKDYEDSDFQVFKDKFEKGDLWQVKSALIIYLSFYQKQLRTAFSSNKIEKINHCKNQIKRIEDELTKISIKQQQ